jgi:hypothetical protein
MLGIGSMKRTVGRKKPTRMEKGRIERSREGTLIGFMRARAPVCLEMGDRRTLMRKKMGIVTAIPRFWKIMPTVPILRLLA